MKRTHWMKAAAAVVVLAAAAPLAWTAPAGNSPLAQVPADAPFVIHLNGLEAVRDHVVAFLKNAAPDQAALVEKQSENFLKNGFQGRKLAGLAKSGPIFVLLTELPKPGASDNPPKMAILAAVTDYAAFRDNVLSDDEKKGLKKGEGFESTASDMGGDIFFVDRKDYVVVTPRKDVAEALAKAPTAGLDGKMGKGQAAKFLASDVGVYVNMEDVNKEYADQIKAARSGAEEALQKAEKQDDKSLKLAVSMAKQVIPPIFQAVEDGRAVLFTLEARPEGVALHTAAAFKDGSTTAGLFKDSKLGAFKEMEKLPAGQFAYVGLSISPALTKLIGPLMHGLAADPDSKGGKAIGEAFDAWVKAGPTEEVVSAAIPPGGVQVVKCADPEKAVEAMTRMLAAQGEEGGFQSAFLKGKPEVKPAAEKYKDIEFTYVHMDFDIEKLIPATAGGKEVPEAMRKAQIEGMRKFMGEGVTAWVGADKEGKQVVQVSAKDWAGAEKLLDQYTKGVHTVGDDKAFSTARKELPAEATVVELIDAVQYVGLIIDFAKPLLESAGTKVPFQLPEAVKGAPPGYIGFAATLEGDAASTDFVITAEAVRQIHKNYVAPMLKTLNKGD